MMCLCFTRGTPRNCTELRRTLVARCWQARWYAYLTVHKPHNHFLCSRGRLISWKLDSRLLFIITYSSDSRSLSLWLLSPKAGGQTTSFPGGGCWRNSELPWARINFPMSFFSKWHTISDPHRSDPSSNLSNTWSDPSPKPDNASYNTSHHDTKQQHYLICHPDCWG